MPSSFSDDAAPVKPLSFTHDVAKGAFSGAVEVIASGQLLWALKTRLQAGEPFTVNPFILYRGIMPHLLGRLPITAAQVGGAEMCMKALRRDQQAATLLDRTVGATVGGMAAALFNAPAETIMTQQQKKATALLGMAADQKHTLPAPSQVARELVREFKWRVLLTGYVGSAVRLTTYNGVIFCGIPVMGASIRQNTQFTETMAQISASMITALLAVFVSNPADLAKTKQQANISGNRMGFLQALQTEYRQYGVKGLWKGFWWRYSRVAVGAVIIDKANTYFDTRFQY